MIRRLVLVSSLCALACTEGTTSNTSPGNTGQVKASLTDAPTDLSNVKQVLVTVSDVRFHSVPLESQGGGGIDAGTAEDAGTGPLVDAGTPEDAGTVQLVDAGTPEDGGLASTSSPANGDDTTGPGWVELCNTPQTYDLLQLTNGRSVPLCNGAAVTVPAGRVSQARLGVTSAKLVFTDNTEQELTVPSGSQSGLKVNVDEDVPAGGTLDIRFDFVAADSIVAKGNGQFSLKPVIKIVKP